MKNILLLCLLTIQAIVLAFNGEYQYAEVKVSEPGDIRFLQKNNIDIDRTSFGMKGIPLDGKITVYITEEQYSLLEEKNYELKWAPLVIPKDSLFYRSNQDIEDSMDVWQARYPDICRKEIVGYSVQNRPLLVLKITDSLDIEEAEPEVKFISTMHGDEVTGMEMEMFMIENILTGYEAGNDTMKFIVDNTELYVMPLMNPDGNELKRRSNANWVDLNRNFPEGTYYHVNEIGEYTPPQGGVTQPETAAMMNWTKEHDFILSTNFHGGALVANYLYDIDFGVPNYSYAACPDDPHVTWLAYNYSVRNTPMYNGSFTDGITNGSEWYQITGGMQDWNYRYHNDIDMTLEISNTKWPNYSFIPGFWTDNREAMFWYLLAAHKGINGIVTDSQTGSPLDATILIDGIDKDYYTDPDCGDYYRILKPGHYSMMVSAEGYESQYYYNIEVFDSLATRIDVQLDPIGYDNTPPVACEMTGEEVEINNPLPFLLNVYEFNEINLVEGVYTINSVSDTITLNPIIVKGIFDFEGVIPAQSTAGKGTIKFLLTDINGNSGESEEYPIAWTDSSGIDNYSVLPEDITLYQNYPNPFNPETRISFKDMELSLKVYDMKGCLVKTLAERRFIKGIHDYSFDGSGLSSGIYEYRLEDINGASVSKKMLMLK